MTDEDLALTHLAAFGPGKGWSAGDFANYLADPTALVEGDASCFIVLRLAGPEAEILTVATHPDVQGQGRAQALLTHTLDHLRNVGVEDVFLDVSETNAAALHVYKKAGFEAFATRRAYYRDGSAAICMKAALSAASSA